MAMQVGVLFFFTKQTPSESYPVTHGHVLVQTECIAGHNVLAESECVCEYVLVKMKHEEILAVPQLCVPRFKLDTDL